MIDINYIISLFDNYNYPLNKYQWVEITNKLLSNLDISNYDIIKYKQSFNNNKIIENVINHSQSHSHFMFYTNPYITNIKLHDVIKLKINKLHPSAISLVWKSGLITTSDFEDKLYYIMSKLIEYNIDSDVFECWLEFIYHIKKKSVNDIIQKLIWNVYDKIFNIKEPIYVEDEILLYLVNDWESNKDKILDELYILSDDIKEENVEALIKGEKDVFYKKKG